MQSMAQLETFSFLQSHSYTASKFPQLMLKLALTEVILENGSACHSSMGEQKEEGHEIRQ